MHHARPGLAQNPRYTPRARVDAPSPPLKFAIQTMVYINSWQKYQEAAENLYANSPRNVSFPPPPPFSILLLPRLAHITACGSHSHTYIHTHQPKNLFTNTLR